MNTSRRQETNSCRQKLESILSCKMDATAIKTKCFRVWIFPYGAQQAGNSGNCSVLLDLVSTQQSRKVLITGCHNSERNSGIWFNYNPNRGLSPMCDTSGPQTKRWHYDSPVSPTQDSESLESGTASSGHLQNYDTSVPQTKRWHWN